MRIDLRGVERAGRYRKFYWSVCAYLTLLPCVIWWENASHWLEAWPCFLVVALVGLCVLGIWRGGLALAIAIAVHAIALLTVDLRHVPDTMRLVPWAYLCALCGLLGAFARADWNLRVRLRATRPLESRIGFEKFDFVSPGDTRSSTLLGRIRPRTQLVGFLCFLSAVVFGHSVVYFLGTEEFNTSKVARLLDEPAFGVFAILLFIAALSAFGFLRERVYVSEARQKKLTARELEEQEQESGRAPIVVFRSFQADKGISGRLPITKRILSLLWHSGPVIMFDNRSVPSNRKPIDIALHTVRGAPKNVSDDEAVPNNRSTDTTDHKAGVEPWKTDARQWMERALAIVVIPGMGQGLVWEVNEIAKSYLDRTVFIYPLQSRDVSWREFADQFGAQSPIRRLRSLSKDTVFARLTPNGNVLSVDHSVQLALLFYFMGKHPDSLRSYVDLVSWNLVIP